MAITLDGIPLPELIIENEFAVSSVQSATEIALDGSPIIWEQEVSAFPLDLVGGDNFGWIDRKTLQQVQMLASVAQAVYPLDLEGQLMTVRFRHEQPPVIEAQPVAQYTYYNDGDFYNNIRLKFSVVR